VAITLPLSTVHLFWQDADIQNTIGFATGVQVTFIATGPTQNNDLSDFLDQANHLLGLENPPQTILNNFVTDESSFLAPIMMYVPQLSNSVTPIFCSSICNVYAQLAARGVSYIVNTGSNCFESGSPFPATCPLYVSPPFQWLNF
jgi:tripeptidyl-peptidase-1